MKLLHPCTLYMVYMISRKCYEKLLMHAIIQGTYYILISYPGPYTFSIGDTSELSDYVSGGYAIQCKMPKTLNFVRIILFIY